jgi:hypothetical protein
VLLGNLTQRFSINHLLCSTRRDDNDGLALVWLSGKTDLVEERELAKFRDIVFSRSIAVVEFKEPPPRVVDNPAAAAPPLGDRLIFTRIVQETYLHLASEESQGIGPTFPLTP